MSCAIIRPALAAAALLAIGGCSTYDNGYGYGYRSASYYDDDYYPSSGSAYSSYYGWYGDYYYPGTGYYVYNRGGDRYRWSDSQRRYWEGRRGREARENWSDYRRERAEDRRDDRREWRDDRRDGRGEWRDDRRDNRRDDRRDRRRDRDRDD